MNHMLSSAVFLCQCVRFKCARKFLTLQEAHMKVTLRAFVWAESRNLTLVFFQPHHKNNILTCVITVPKGLKDSFNFSAEKTFTDFFGSI